MAAWAPVGRISVDGFSREVVVGSLPVPPATERLLIRCRDTSGQPVFPYGYGLVSWRSAAGREFGTARVYGHAEWEVIELPVTARPQETAGALVFEPRSYNTRWMTADPPQVWTLEIEAMPVIPAAASNGNRIIETGDRYVVWGDQQGRQWMDAWGNSQCDTSGWGDITYPKPFIERPSVSVTAVNDPAGGFLMTPTLVIGDSFTGIRVRIWGFNLVAGGGSWNAAAYLFRWRAIGMIAAAP